ncbi:MAG: hypothetical protein WC156_02675 [Pedobacter sp.]
MALHFAEKYPIPEIIDVFIRESVIDFLEAWPVSEQHQGHAPLSAKT